MMMFEQLKRLLKASCVCGCVLMLCDRLGLDCTRFIRIIALNCIKWGRKIGVVLVCCDLCELSARCVSYAFPLA